MVGQRGVTDNYTAPVDEGTTDDTTAPSDEKEVTTDGPWLPASKFTKGLSTVKAASALPSLILHLKVSLD